MRDYGKVQTSFWSSDTIRSMTETGRMLALYLITSPHSTIAGVFRLPDGYVCEDLQWPSERVAEGFAELFAKGFANRCETTKWVWVAKHLEWNPPENPNQRKSAAKVALGIPDQCVWKLNFMRVCGPSLGFEPADLPNPPGTLSKGLPNQEQKQEQKQKQKQDGSADLLTGVDASPPLVPIALIPLIDGTDHPVMADQAAEWQLAYPRVDIPGELARIRSWCNANRTNRKTKRGVDAFLVRWLSKAQDKGGSGGRFDTFTPPSEESFV